MSKKVSSAEFIAKWRCAESHISRDTQSIALVSKAGHQAIEQYVTRSGYTMAPRHMSVRAGWFYDQACKLLASGEYDCVVSLGSGASCLTNLLQTAFPVLEYYDIDLPDMIALREARLPTVSTQHIALDLIEAAKKNVSLNTVTSYNKKPLFILEGLIYFLTRSSLEWLLTELSHYSHKAILLDYFPNNALELSALFRQEMAGKVNEHIKENFDSLFADWLIDALSKQFNHTKVITLTDAEKAFCENLSIKPLLTDPNTFFPAKLFVGY